MARITKQDRLKRTAHHEAGHALVCFGLRKAFSDLTIVETDEFYGAMSHRAWLKIDPGITSYEWEAQDIKRIKIDILVSLGGPAAENLFVGRTLRRNFAPGTDHAKVLEVLTLLYGGLDSDEAGMEVGKYIEYTEIVAKNYIAMNWKFLERLANALVKQETMTYVDAKKLVNRDKFLPFEEMRLAGLPTAPKRLRHL